MKGKEMRKVYATVSATVMVPVQVKFDIIASANEGVDIDRAVRRWAKGRQAGADIEVEDVTDMEINGYKDPDDWTAGVEEVIQSSENVTVHAVEITDSK
jgi:hypothetical protein